MGAYEPHPQFSTWASFWGWVGGLLLGQTVAKVQVNSEGRAQGVTLQDGEEVRSRVVLSCASPQVTFLELTPQVRLVRGEIACPPYRPWNVVWGAHVTPGWTVRELRLI